MNTAFKKGVLKSELSYKMVQIFFSKNIETNYSQWRNLSKVYLSIGHFADGIWMNGVGHSLLSSVWYLEKGPTLRTPFVRADPKSRHLCCMKLIGYSETETGQAIQKRWHNRNRNAFILIRFPMRCVKSLGIHAHLLLLETHIFSFFHFFFSIKLFYCLHNWTCVSYNKDL